MIQRIQTLYLLAGGALLVVFLGIQSQWAPVASSIGPVGGYVLMALAGLAALLAFGAVALYKNRALQRRVITWTLWLDLLLVAGYLAGLFLSVQQDAPVPQGVLLGALAPVVAYVLLRLARAGVERDIETVRSMDRIR